MSSSSPPPSVRIPALWLSDLEHSAAPYTEWLWQGILARGNLTLFTSQWKAGKTTLLSILLDRMKKGGDIAGLAVRPGKAVIVSEEPTSLWLERSRRFNFAGHVCWICRPFPGRPTHDDWLTLIDRLLELHAEHGLSLVAIDPLAAFLPPGSENDAGLLMAALLPLQRLTNAGLAVLILHHPRKRESLAGQASRGTGAMCSVADVLVEMHLYDPSAPSDRRRRLRAWTRHEGEPLDLLMELTPDGDYVRIAEPEEESSSPHRNVLFTLLADLPTKITRNGILQEWPSDHPRPTPMTLWRLLERAVERGELKRDAAGTKRDPFRYWLPSLEERWRSDPLAEVLQKVADSQRKLRLDLHPWPPDVDEEEKEDL